MLMAVVSLGFVVGMPYLMDSSKLNIDLARDVTLLICISVDEETKAEFKAIQEKSPLTQATNAASLGDFDLAGWMAGKKNDDKTKTT